MVRGKELPLVLTPDNLTPPEVPVPKEAILPSALQPEKVVLLLPSESEGSSPENTVEPHNHPCCQHQWLLKLATIRSFFFS